MKVEFEPHVLRYAVFKIEIVNLTHMGRVPIKVATGVAILVRKVGELEGKDL